VRPDPRDFLPVKDLAYRILLALADGERHGWSLVQTLDDGAPGARVLPGHLYRTLDRMLADGLIDEREPSPTLRKAPGTRGTAPSRFFRLTPLGRDVARAETRRLEALVGKARAGTLLRGRR
jgi:DNA-binding PadR family transcriptional regulator